MLQVLKGLLVITKLLNKHSVCSRYDVDGPKTDPMLSFSFTFFPQPPPPVGLRMCCFCAHGNGAFAGHATCLELTPDMVAAVKTYPWQCVECRVCDVCDSPEREVRMCSAQTKVGVSGCGSFHFTILDS